MKKFAAVLMTLILLLSATAMADITLVKTYSTDELRASTYHNGFVTALGCMEVNTLVLKDDGTYVYTKDLFSTDESGNRGVNNIYIFCGSYTREGNMVVLAFPASATASEYWGSLSGSYFSAGIPNAAYENSNYATGLLCCKQDESHLIADLFESPCLIDMHTTSSPAFNAAEHTVTITITEDTFDYNS